MSSVLNRRNMLANCGYLATGAALGSIASHLMPRSNTTLAREKTTDISPEQRIQELGLELPPVVPPANTYVPTVQVGNLLFVAGHGPRRPADGGPLAGKVGRDLDLDQGNQAARLVGLRVLAVVRDALGSLDRVERLVKTLGMVNCTTDFRRQPQVINGFSDLMVEVFGEQRGKGARSAVGMGSLPGGIPVEIETVFQVRNS